MEFMKMKIAVSVLANDNGGYAGMVEGCRNTWAKNCPENTKVYFNYGIRYMNTHGIEVPEDMNVIVIEPDIMVCNAPEAYRFLLQKQIMAFDALLQMDDYDYIVRPNCGSYINLDLLNDFLEDKPRTGFYCGIVNKTEVNKDTMNAQGLRYNPENFKALKDLDLEYASGSCMIFSRDVIKYIVDNLQDLNYDGTEGIMDDVSIGMLLDGKFDLTEGQRVDVNSEQAVEEKFDPTVYHYYYQSTRNSDLHYKVHELFEGVKV